MKIKLTSRKEFEAAKGVKYFLHKKLAKSDPPRSLEILHASELTHPDRLFCPRERAFLLRDGDNRKDFFLGTALNITFAVGRWYEHKIRNEWLRDMAIGTWVCDYCQTRHHYQTVPEECSDCGDTRYLEYEEPRAHSKKYGISCGIDLLMWRDNRITVIEIKTMEKTMFKALKAPMHEHFRRTQFYLELLADSQWVDFDVEFNFDFAYILYVCKGFGFKDNYLDREGLADTTCSPFKEYKIPRAENGPCNKSLKPLFDQALEVDAYKMSQQMPKRVICPTPTCTRAKDCTYRKECFNE